MKAPKQHEYAINYQSAVSTNNDGGILLPGNIQPRPSETEASDEKGLVIAPEPSIVIKTKLQRNDSNGPSLSSVLNISSSSNDTSSPITGETKVFLNICMHDLISLPTKRKTIDQESGEEVEGWHLPMSMGELRPCFDKHGNAAIVADCIMNPSVVKDMHHDSNHFHFVSDLVIQCANRKFSRACFEGLELDKRYKVPKMKYAGYVDEKSGLPTDTRICQAGIGVKPVVAKQRVKGNGRSKPIIQEIDSAPKVTPVSSCDTIAPKIRPQQQLSLIPIELFVEVDCKRCVPLQDFLHEAAKEVIEGALQMKIKCPERKHAPLDESSSFGLHSSQLIKAPLPYCFSSSQAIASSASFAPTNIVARCRNATADLAVEVSAFMLVLSSLAHSRTECVLPFPINTQKTKCTFDAATGALEVQMPLLRDALCVQEGPDPGTKQWELANAFSRATDTETDSESREGKEANASTVNTSEFSHLFQENEDCDSVDDDQELPEDVFHSQDALSRHYLQQQQEEQNAKNNNHEELMASHDGEKAELIDIKDFRPGGKYFEQDLIEQPEKKDSLDDAILKKAKDVFKQSLDENGLTSFMDSNLDFGLV